MKKVSKAICMLIPAAMFATFISCDVANALEDDMRDFFGDPVAETNFFNCGISHSKSVTGIIGDKQCDVIDLVPSETYHLQAYNLVNGTRADILRGNFFYFEDLANVDNGELWISLDVGQYYRDGKWVSPNYGTDDFFVAKNVNLVTQNTAVITAEPTTKEAYNARREEFEQYRAQKSSGSDDPTGITIDDFEPERIYYLDAFNTALAAHDPATTVIEYAKVNGFYTYLASFDGSSLELMIFTGDGEMFFYPIEGQTDKTYMLGMYAYNRATKPQRRWIRETYLNIGSLYDELKEKAAAAKAAATGK